MHISINFQCNIVWSFMIRLSFSCSIDRQPYCRRGELDVESDFREFYHKMRRILDKWTNGFSLGGMLYLTTLIQDLFFYFLNPCSSATLRNNGWMDINEIFRISTLGVFGLTVSRLIWLFHTPQTRRAEVCPFGVLLVRSMVFISEAKLESRSWTLTAMSCLQCAVCYAHSKWQIHQNAWRIGNLLFCREHSVISSRHHGWKLDVGPPFTKYTILRVEKSPL